MLDFRFADAATFEKTVEFRREFHKYPEVGWNEYRTTARIAEEMEKLGYKIYYGKEYIDADSRVSLVQIDDFDVLKDRAEKDGAKREYLEKIDENFTGLCAIKKFGTGGPVTILRFDIDALPVNEPEKDAHKPFREGFASKYKGYMHACGHDSHIAVGLGMAMLIENMKDSINGEIRFVFQPAEEECKGGMSVANGGMAEGADYYLCGHMGMNLNKTGLFAASCYGFLSTSKFNVTFKGTPAHAANSPEKGRSAINAAAAFILGVNSIPRHSEGNTFVNVGRIEGGTVRNVVAENVVLEMETRGLNNELNTYMKDSVLRLAEGCAKMYDVEISIEDAGECGSADCSEEMRDMVFDIAKEMGLEESIKEIYFGASEDAIYMMNAVKERGGKCTYMMFGSELAAPHHNCDFDFNEDTMRIMEEIYCRSIEKLMCK